MPFGIVQIPKRVSLTGELLDAIFAEQLQSSVVSFADAFCGKCLADRHQLDFFWTALGAVSGNIDSLTHPGQILRN
jgi:hypothetical protein